MEDTCFGEVREGSHEWKANPGIREPWHTKDVGPLLADMWDYSTVTVEESQSTEQIFARLAEQWSEEVGHMSSLVIALSTLLTGILLRSDGMWFHF